MEFLFWDPTFLLLIPAVLLAIFAHTRVRSTYQRYSRVPNSGGYRGRDVARALLQANGITDVEIERAEGQLSDHYGPRRKVLRLSPGVHDGKSVAALGIARTFQTTKLFPHMTVLENVMVGRHARTRSGFIAGMLNLPWTWREDRQTKDKAMEILENLGLASYAPETASNLPFGRQRLVEFARALATEPTLLLLDEPAAGLNIYETQELAELIQRIRDRGITCLIVEHDMSLVMNISDEVVVLDEGKQIAEGPPAAIQRNPDVIRIYLGDDHA